MDRMLSSLRMRNRTHLIDVFSLCLCVFLLVCSPVIWLLSMTERDDEF